MASLICSVYVDNFHVLMLMSTTPCTVFLVSLCILEDHVAGSCLVCVIAFISFFSSPLFFSHTCTHCGYHLIPHLYLGSVGVVIWCTESIHINKYILYLNGSQYWWLIGAQKFFPFCFVGPVPVLVELKWHNIL